ncbi:hypothetical protein I308_103896 [Cryptococcus tetragattii IND107]|uniref:Monopolin complex subunit Csm1/Pcs1 C-terminal domain-containing protein n=1 Tax=Cryptococcus tetragattii IND107 TaxID=1296105 RepID=A0ABR3BT13_9TREE|nr:hypothetical protein I308_03254 [Cryptococcus tetragattii IND107]
MAPSTASRTMSKKSGKENMAPSRAKGKAVAEEDVKDGSSTEMSGDEEPRKSATKSKGKRPLHESEFNEESVKGLKKRLASVTSERDWIQSQSDKFSKQFEELSKLRSTDAEALLQKYKEKTEIQAKAQNDIIASQTALTEKLQAKVQSLEKSLAAAREAAIPVESNAKPDPKEVRALKDEIAKMKSEINAKDQRIVNLEREYKAEVEHSRSLQDSSKNPSSTLASDSVSQTLEEAEKDHASLALYEQLSLMNIVNVKIKDSRFGKERTFNCVMCVNGKSLNFRLRCYTEVDKKQDKSNPDYPYVKVAHYTPELLQNESEEFVEKLEYFAREFTVPRRELGGFFAELRSKMADDEE